MVATMKHYRVTGPRYLMRSGTVGLTEEQARRCGGNVVAKTGRGADGVYQVIGMVVFPRGEIIRLEEAAAAPNAGHILAEIPAPASRKGGD